MPHSLELSSVLCVSLLVFSRVRKPSGWILCPPETIDCANQVARRLDVGKPLQHNVQVSPPTVNIAVLQSGIFRALRATTGCSFFFVCGCILVVSQDLRNQNVFLMFFYSRSRLTDRSYYEYGRGVYEPPAWFYAQGSRCSLQSVASTLRRRVRLSSPPLKC